MCGTQTSGPPAVETPASGAPRCRDSRTNVHWLVLQVLKVPLCGELRWVQSQQQWSTWFVWEGKVPTYCFFESSTDPDRLVTEQFKFLGQHFIVSVNFQVPRSSVSLHVCCWVSFSPSPRLTISMCTVKAHFPMCNYCFALHESTMSIQHMVLVLISIHMQHSLIQYYFYYDNACTQCFQAGR